MARVFSDLMDELREMLRRVRAGSALTHIPPGEVDLSVEIPVVTPHTGFEAHQPTTASRWEQRVGGESRLPGARRGIALVALAVVGIGAGVFGLRAQHQSPAAPVGAGSASTSGPVPSAAEAPVTAPSAMPPATAAASPVILHIETRPAAAHVFFQGADRGASPVDLSIDRGKSPVGLELRAQGFTTLTETVVPDMDQRLVLTLSPATVAVRHPSPPSPKPPPPPAAATTHPAAPAASEAGGFHRFE
jgi:hypothetical protein